MSERGDKSFPEWLSPSVALCRFQLDPADLASARDMAPEKIRYAAHVGAVGILLPEDTVSEVFERSEIYSIPNTAPWFLGLVNLRGNLVPVFELRSLLDTAPHAQAKQMILVIDKGERAFGLAVDGAPVAATDKTPAGDVSLPPAIETFTRAAFKEGGEVWLDVDLPAFLSSLSRKIAA